MTSKNGTIKDPANLAKLKGQPGHRPLNPNEPIVQDTGLPKPPKDLDDPEIEIWDSLAQMLYDMGVFRDPDIEELAMLCRAKVRYMDASEQLKEEGYVSDGAQGGRILNPLVRVMEQAANEMHRIRQNFGMTPAARTKIAATPPEKKTTRFDGQSRKRA